ncbi:MAG: hypothetical protein QOC77_3666 [Thermoleophilaceae bacterium]|nr:hypothetical protein [Thermoleophilaceae bacterium]
MHAIGSPAAAGEAGPYAVPDRRDWLKLAGGMMFGAGVIVLLARKGQDWSNWAIFAVLLIAALILLGLAVVQRVPGELGGWRTGFLVFGTLLLLAALLQLVNAANGNPGKPLNLFWTFGIAGALAVVSSLALRAHVQMLVGALLWLVAWLALWNKLASPTADTRRWLLIALAAIYVGAALVLSRMRRRPQASDLITVAGIAAVAAAIISLAAAAQSLVGVGSAAPGGLPGGVPKPGQGWNVFLLVVSLLLIGYSSRGPTRGPGYVGALGLFGFIGLTGLDLVNRINGDQAGGVAGWPLILLIGGAILVAAGFVLRPGALGGPGAGGPGQTQPGAAQPPPPQAPPVQPPPGQQPGTPLEQWRQQPPPPGQPPAQ